MLSNIAKAVREAIEVLFPSDPSKPIPAPDPDPRTETQQVEEPARDKVTEAFLDSGEDLLDPSRVRLFGVPFLTLKLAPEDLRKYRYSNKLLQQKILQADAGLARVYGFSYEGRYHKLPKPYIFMVHGPGRSRLENRPASVTNWGVDLKDFQFPDDMRVWEMDKEDMTLRIDVVSGFLSDILLDPVLRAGSELAGRQDSGGTAGPGGRQDLVSRAEMSARHRARD